MDYHAEQIVVKLKTAREYILATFIVLATVILWFLIFTMLSQFSTIAALLVLVVGWGAWKLIQSFNIEYEYDITNQYLEIDKIMGMARRKHLFSIDLKNIKRCNYVDSPEFKNENNVTKVYDFSGNPQAKGRVFIDFIPEEKIENVRIIFRPNEKIIKIINTADPRNIAL